MKIGKYEVTIKESIKSVVQELIQQEESFLVIGDVVGKKEVFECVKKEIKNDRIVIIGDNSEKVEGLIDKGKVIEMLKVKPEWVIQKVHYTGVGEFFVERTLKENGILVTKDGEYDESGNIERIIEAIEIYVYAGEQGEANVYKRIHE